jgi:hypothetical protein
VQGSHLVNPGTGQKEDRAAIMHKARKRLGRELYAGMVWILG